MNLLKKHRCYFTETGLINYYYQTISKEIALNNKRFIISNNCLQLQ